MKACPCLHTTPCQENCSCIKPYSSKGCLRCCSYGSQEQQKARAIRLARIIDAGMKPPTNAELAEMAARNPPPPGWLD